MKQNIVLAGVGGQGILTIAAAIARAGLAQGLNIKQSEVHGMAQRGGAVEAHLRLSDERIYSDLVPEGSADLILAIEPLEALRQKRYLSGSGWLVASRTPVLNIPDYPDLEQVCAEIECLPRSILLQADALAAEAGSSRAMNMVMLGAASTVLALTEDALLAAVREMFASKGDKVIQTNVRAFGLGRTHAAESA
jgi:indolepyruvate ferredoxin oxidoreductase beta subunit